MAVKGDPARRILVVAGEASGDQAAAPVVAALLEREPTWKIEAVGGPCLAAAGAEIILPYEEVAVMGFTEVIGRLPALRRHEAALGRKLDSGELDLFLPVDFPGLNLRLAKRASRAGLPVLYFVAPQVWAWNKGRVEILKKSTNQLALILPFEKAWFEAEGVDCEFVGHPLMETPNPFAGKEIKPCLGLLPGSRAQEVRQHLPLMLDVARRLSAQRPELEFALLESPGLPPEFYASWLADAGVDIIRYRGDGGAFYASLGAACVASGTATLETAVAGVPMVVIYKSSAITHWLARRLVKVDHFALANLVAGRKIVPELLQNEANPERLADLLGDLLVGGEAREAQRCDLRKLRGSLGEAGCGERVAALAAELVERS